MVASLWRRLSERWDEYFFRPAPASALAAFRIAFYLCALIHEIVHYSLNYFGYPAYLFKASGLFLLFPVAQPATEIMTLLYVILAVLLVLSAAGSGAAVRLSAALIALYIYGIRYNYGFNFKAEGGVSVCLLLMVFSKCDDSFSLRNRWWPSRRPDPQSLATASARGLYSWPMQFTRVYWVFMIFSAGLFKLKYTGWGWAAQDSIHFVLVRQMYYFYPQSSPPTPLGQFMLEHPSITLLGSWLSLGVELLAPLMLLGGRFRWIILANLLVMLVLVRFSMHHSFVIAQMPLYIALLPWEKLGPRFLDSQPPEEKVA